MYKSIFLKYSVYSLSNLTTYVMKSCLNPHNCHWDLRKARLDMETQVIRTRSSPEKPLVSSVRSYLRSLYKIPLHTKHMFGGGLSSLNLPVNIKYAMLCTLERGFKAEPLNSQPSGKTNSLLEPSLCRLLIPWALPQIMQKRGQR